MYRANLKNSPLEEGIRTIGPSRGLSPIRAVGAETDVGRRNARSSTAGPMVRIRFPPRFSPVPRCATGSQPPPWRRSAHGLGREKGRAGENRCSFALFLCRASCSPTSGELPNRLGRVDAASRRRDSTHPAPARLLRHEVAHANWFDDYGSGQLLIGTELMLVLRAAFDNPVTTFQDVRR